MLLIHPTCSFALLSMRKDLHTITHTHTLTYTHTCTHAHTHAHTCSTCSFVLLNMRKDFHFKLIRGGYAHPRVIAEVGAHFGGRGEKRQAVEGRCVPPALPGARAVQAGVWAAY